MMFVKHLQVIVLSVFSTHISYLRASSNRYVLYSQPSESIFTYVHIIRVHISGRYTSTSGMSYKLYVLPTLIILINRSKFVLLRWLCNLITGVLSSSAESVNKLNDQTDTNVMGMTSLCQLIFLQ